MAKKVLKIALGIFTLFIVAAIAVPMFVKVDQYRPAIVKAINEKIHGKIELGTLKLSLWGQIKIQIDGLKLQDALGKEIISVKDAYFHLPFSSVFAGSPNLTLKLKSPHVALWKTANGQWNVMGLMKAQPKAESKESSSSSIALPALALRSRLSIALQEANVDVEDRTTGMKTKLKDFDLSLQEISLSRPIRFSLAAKIDASQKQAEGGAMTVEGPFEIKGVFEPKFSDATLDSFETEMTADFTQLSIHKPGLFHKKSGTPVKLEAKASGDPTRIIVEKIDFQLQALVLNAKGKIERASEMVSFDANTNEVDLAKLSDLMEKGGELNGRFSMKAHVEGPTSKLGFAGEVKLDGMTYKSPMMKNAAKIDAYVKAKLEEIETLRLTINAPGTDLKVSGSIKNMMGAPILALKIDSNEMDLNRLIDLPDPKAKKKEEAAPSGEASKSQGASGKVPPSEDLDASFDSLRKNERASKLSGSIDVNFKSIQVYDIKINTISMMTRIQNLSASIEPLKLQIWDGTIQGSMKTDLKPARPTYSFQTSVNGLDLKKAVESQMALFKNTLIGKVNLSVKGSGSSFVSTRATPALGLQGNFKVADAVFATIDIGKMVTEAVNGSIAKVSDKIPGLKGKSIKALPNSTSKYQFISSSFSMSNGTFRAPDFTGKAIPNQGIDVEGATNVNLVTEDVDAKWKLIDTYNLTKAKDISVDIGGQKVDSILVEKGKALVLPVTVGCKMKAPCMNYSEAPASLAKVALGNATGAAKSKVKQEVQQKVLEKAPEPVKNILKKLPGGLFGN